MTQKIHETTECGNTALEAWERLRSNVKFYYDNKSLLNIDSFKLVKMPKHEELEGIDFMGLGKLVNKDILYKHLMIESKVASCYLESKGIYHFLWIEEV